MRSMNFAQDINVIGLDLKVTGIYHAGDPGRMSGPPEHCYPPEPAEVDVHTLTYVDEEGKEYNMMPLTYSDMAEEISEKCIDAVTEWLCNER